MLFDKFLVNSNILEMKVLQVTTNYPTIKYPAFGIFVKEQIESIEKLGVVNTIFYSNGKENVGIK